MPKPEVPELSRLKAAIDGALAGLNGVEAKRLFGCDGYFVGGNIFALVWKEGRLGLRFESAQSLAEAHALAGSCAWEIGAKRMQQWVLLPVALHHQPAKLRSWGRLAWEQARQRPERPRVTRKPGAAKVVKPAVFRRLPKPKE
ncbi:MAG TPA: TfoX/Sxy family protein [bacterium]|nr:TfoX/Sxy family protein [bacterium]